MSYTNGLDNPELYFQVKLYSGNGSTQSITLDGDEDMQPDLVWLKARAGDNISNWRSVDSVRGATIELYQDANSAEETNTNGLTGFDSDGFSLGNSGGTNEGGTIYGAWNWKESATAGFDIVGYTGDGTADLEIGHSLSAVPHFIIIKNRDDAEDWLCYHQGMTDDYNNKLNTTDAEFGGAYIFDPTSSIFTLRDHNVVNDDGDDYIAYCFSEKQGFSKFGSYEGNGSTTATGGPFIYTGFSPSFVIIKDVDAVANWEMFDNKRIVAGYPAEMHPHANAAQSVPPGDRRLYFTSNGFKIDTSHAPPINASGETYIYLAFAEAPLVNSNGVPCNAR